MTTHLRDTRRPEGSAVTKGGRIRQIPVICAVDLIIAHDFGSGTTLEDPWYTDEPELVDCDDCLERLDVGVAGTGAPIDLAMMATTYSTTHASDRCERAVKLLRMALRCLQVDLSMKEITAYERDLVAFLAEEPS